MKSFKQFAEDKPITHHVVNNKTGDVVSKHTNLKSATRSADKKDLQYGAIAHRVVRLPIGEDGSAVAVAGPTNSVGTGAIAGSGGLGGEPGVNMKKKNRVVMAPTFTRKPPKI